MKKLPRPVWILSWVSFFADVSSEMVYPLLPLFLISVLGTSKTQLGAMEGLAVLIVALMSAFAGIRSDQKGRRGGRVWWIRWGYALPVIGKLIISCATSWQWVVGGRMLDRFGKGLRGAPRDALIADAVSSEQRGQAFGLHRAFDTAGALVGVVIAAFLLWLFTGVPRTVDTVPYLVTSIETPEWVYRGIFGVASVLGIISFVLTFNLHDAKSKKEESTAIEAMQSDSSTISIESSSNNRSRWTRLPISYWYVLGILIIFSLANSSDTFLLLRTRDLGFSPWVIVLIYAFYNVTYSLLSYPAGAWSDRIGRWRIIAIGWTIYACVYAGFAFLPPSQAWGAWPLMAIYGAYMALTDGVGKALIADHAPADLRGAAMGLYYALTGLTTLVASLTVGVVWDFYGPNAAFAIGAGFAILALAALSLAGKRVEPSMETP